MYEFLDGVVFAHVCDVACMVPSMWRQAVPTPYTFFLDVPHTTRTAALEYFRGALNDYRKSLEEYCGKRITDAGLADAVAAHNEQRVLARRLYDLRKTDPPMISGSETLQVLKATMSLPVAEGSELLKEVIAEVSERKVAKRGPKARLLVWGSVIDDTAFLEMVESLDADVVMDDTCVGSRAFASDVPVTPDPLDGLASHYLIDIRCPRTFREATPGAARKDYAADLEARFGYLRDYVRDWKVDGAILQSVRYCDGHGYEVPAVRDFFESMGIASIYLEHNYTRAALAPLRTRVQGLTEIIG
jgi:benzoyl-CoA reductase/2-hydroxyglutaryl-CoA dehydratase subunit BcrC/BadD/HgdB